MNNFLDVFHPCSTCKYFVRRVGTGLNDLLQHYLVLLWERQGPGYLLPHGITSIHQSSEADLLQKNRWDLNPRPLGSKQTAIPLSHHTTSISNLFRCFFSMACFLVKEVLTIQILLLFQIWSLFYQLMLLWIGQFWIKPMISRLKNNFDSLVCFVKSDSLHFLILTTLK